VKNLFTLIICENHKDYQRPVFTDMKVSFRSWKPG